MFEDFLDHMCNIYHLEDENVSIGYGIKGGSVKMPQKEPSEKAIPCHFHRKTNTLRIVQHKPYTSLSGEVKLSLPIGADIRENDTVEDCESGVSYRASVPEKIRDHHLIVTLFRDEGEGAAI